MPGNNKFIPTLAVLAVISLVLTGARRTVPSRVITKLETELELQAVSLAQQIFEESNIRSYDEHSVDEVPVKIPDHFTSSSSLGPDSGETDRILYDDFDDYNGYKMSIRDDQGNTLYTLHAKVTYVRNTTYTPTDEATTCKMLVININSPLLQKRENARDRAFTFDYVRCYYIN